MVTFCFEPWIEISLAATSRAQMVRRNDDCHSTTTLVLEEVWSLPIWVFRYRRLQGIALRRKRSGAGGCDVESWGAASLSVFS